MSDNMNQSIIEAQVPWYVGSVATTIGLCVTHPLDLVRVNITGNALHLVSIKGVIRNMLQRRGLRGLYYAFPGAVFKNVTQCWTRFAFFHEFQYHPWILKFKPYDQTTLAALGGLFSGIVSSPFAKVAIRMQCDLTRSPRRRRNYKSVWSALQVIYRNGGVQALCTGIELHALHCMLISLGQVIIYAKIRDQLMSHRELNIENWQTYFISSTITFGLVTLILTPFDGMKTLAMNIEYYDYRNSWRVFKLLKRVHGLPGFFLGLKPALIRIIPHSCLVAMSFDIFANYVVD